MKRAKYVFVAVLIFFSLIACTAQQPLTVDITEENITSSIKRDDTIKIFTNTGEQNSIRVTSIEDGNITGINRYGKVAKFELNEIERIERIESLEKIASNKKSTDAVANTLLYVFVVAPIIMAIVLTLAF